MGVEKVAFPREFFFVPERTDLNRTDRFERARSFWGFQSFRLLDTSHLFLSQNFPNGVSCSGKSGMNFPEHGTAGWGSGKSEKVSGCSKLPPETSRAHLVPLKFPGENFPFTIRNSLTRQGGKRTLQRPKDRKIGLFMDKQSIRALFLKFSQGVYHRATVTQARVPEPPTGVTRLGSRGLSRPGFETAPKS